MKVVIFLGPTLPVAEARRYLEDAIYLPPAGQSDMLSAVVELRPDVIGLIDGVFLQSLSIWHKEILFALKQGIRVYGSSSMGALRAAETDAFGMVGVGEVYRQYSSGELSDDDEVALAHGTHEQGYRPLSVPMVNVRATLRAAHAAGILDSAQLGDLQTLFKRIYFAERSLAKMREVAVESGLAGEVVEALFAFMKSNAVDLKRQDAIELLTTIASLSKNAVPPPAAEFEFQDNIFFKGLYHRDRRVQRADIEIPLETVSNYVALHEPNFEQLNFGALNPVLAVEFARHIGVTVSAEDIAKERRRFQTRWNLQTQRQMSDWLAENSLREADLEGLLEQVALCRRLHQWYIIRNFFHRTTNVVLDELRLTGQYSKWVDRAIEEERLLRSPGAEEAMAAAQKATPQTLAARHRNRSSWNPSVDLETWAEESGFPSLENLRTVFERAQAAEDCLLNKQNAT